MGTFDEIPASYAELCKLIHSLELPPQGIFDRLKKDLDSHQRRICVGSGRSGYVADLFKILLRNLRYNEVYGPDDVPYIFTPRDIILPFSGSGTSKLYTLRTAKDADAEIVGWTSHPESEMGRLSDYVVHIEGKCKTDYENDYDTRQIIGFPSAPLTPLGSMFELRALFATLSFIEDIDKGTEVRDVYHRLCSLCKDYRPSASQFRELYELMPRPRSLENPSTGKTVVVGEGFSGIVGEFFTTRLRHCVKESEERDVNFYKDSGTVSLNKNDLVIIISGSGGERFYETTKKVREKKGAKVGLITSYPTEEWDEISDVVIKIPGRVIEKVKGLRSSYVPKEAEKSIFELITLLSLETLIYAINQEEKITETELRVKHSDFT